LLSWNSLKYDLTFFMCRKSREGYPILQSVSQPKIDIARKAYNRGASNGNVYNLNVYFLEDAKRNRDGQRARSKTWFARLFA